jgi:hypothetical protein
LRRHDFTADEPTRAALAMLARPWAHHSASESLLEVRLRGGVVVRIEVEARDVEPYFECLRLTATASGAHALHGGSGPFASGAARVTLLRGEDWISATVDGAHDDTPGMRPPPAVATCAVDDGLLLEGADADRLLVHCGWPPYALSLTRDPHDIEAFCAGRVRVDLVAPDG